MGGDLLALLPQLTASRDAAAATLRRGHAPDFSVIIATRDRAESLRETLTSVANQKTDGCWTYEVLVVDNGSSDHTRRVVEALSAEFPVPLRYLYEGRPGKPWALNAGMQEAKGKLFAFTDDDVLVTPSWLQVLWRCFAETHADAISGRVLPIWTAPRPAWLTDETFRLLGGMGCIDHGDLRRNTLDGHNCRGVGGNMAIHREAVQRVGAYDMRMNRSQDTEYYHRCVRKRLQVIYEPAAIAHHKIPSERMTPAYFRQWRHRTGYYKTYMVPWRKRHLLTLMPMWRYKKTAKLMLKWTQATVSLQPWEERFRYELMLREDLSSWKHRLQLWPHWWLTMVTGRRYVP